MIFLLHIPSDQLQLRPCYQTIPLNEWASAYIDAFSDAWEGEEEELAKLAAAAPPAIAPNRERDGTLQWIRIAFGLATTPLLDDVRREFQGVAEQALIQVRVSILYVFFTSLLVIVEVRFLIYLLLFLPNDLSGDQCLLIPATRAQDRQPRLERTSLLLSRRRGVIPPSV